MAGGGESSNLEHTPTWIVAVVCTVIVTISFIFERLLHLLGEKLLKAKKHRYLKDALSKVKEELMLLGFISLMLAVFNDRLSRICIPERYVDKWLPCKLPEDKMNTKSHFQTSVFGRRLLAAGGTSFECPAGKAPFLSLTAIHDLHIFIFVLAMVNLVMNAITVLLGSIKIRQWGRWEKAIQKKLEEENDLEDENKITDVQNNTFIKKYAYTTDNYYLSWLISFFKHLYWSLDASDYEVLRASFIQAHCNGYKKFDFYKFILRAYESDFTVVVGVSWYLWIFMVAFLLLNIAGWNFYFWLAFVPLVLVLLIGTKLVNVVSQLAKEVRDKSSVLFGDRVAVRPSDEHFWCNTPKYFLILIHITLFQIAFEIAVFFWVWVLFGFESCQNGKLAFIIPRLFVVVFVEFVCSYNTLPLYAIVTKMGSSVDKAIFDEPVQQSLHNWVRNVRKKNKTQEGGGGTPKGNGVEFAEIDIDIETEMQQTPGPSHNQHHIQPTTTS